MLVLSSQDTKISILRLRSIQLGLGLRHWFVGIDAGLIEGSG